jgi:hypothetical protein
LVIVTVKISSSEFEGLRLREYEPQIPHFVRDDKNF